MALHPETKKLMEDFFSGKKCCVCGSAAQRWRVNRFYCHECYQGYLNEKYPSHYKIPSAKAHLRNASKTKSE